MINAFCHRDYTMLGTVRVLIDDEGMTISSPGGFIDGVTLENLLTVEPHGKNPALADALKRIGLAEKTGRGIDRIYEGSIIYGRPWPDYSETTSTNVRLFIQRAKADDTFTKFIADEQNRLGKPLSIYALMILSLLKNEKRLTIARIAEMTHLAERKLLGAMEIRNILKCFGLFTTDLENMLRKASRQVKNPMQLKMKVQNKTFIVESAICSNFRENPLGIYDETISHGSSFPLFLISRTHFCHHTLDFWTHFCYHVLDQV